LPKAKSKKKTSAKKKKQGRRGPPKGSKNHARKQALTANQRAALQKIHGSSRLTPELKVEVAKLIARGYSQYAVAKIVGVSQATVCRWIALHDDLRINIKLQEQLATDMVERSLFDKAMAYVEHEREIEVDEDGVERTVRVKEKTKSGDTAAAIFWLKNKRPDAWKDRQEIYNDGAIAHDVRLKIIERVQQMSPEQKLARIEELRQRALLVAKTKDKDVIDAQVEEQ